MASVGFVQQTWRVSEDSQQATLLVESDGRNVDPVALEYLFQNTSDTAEGIVLAEVLSLLYNNTLTLKTVYLII